MLETMLPLLWGSIGGVLLFMGRIAFKQGALELKVDTMWAFQMRRAVSEVVQTNAGTLNSPLRVTEEAKQNLDEIKGELQSYWKKSWYKMKTFDALMQIERHFGDRLLNLICIPCKMSHGACLIVALAVAAGDSVVEIGLH